MKILFLFISLLYVWTTPVFAHVVRHASNVGVTLHIEPNDVPIAGQPTQIMVDIVDPDKRFNPNNCDCRLTISQATKVLQELPIVSAGNFNQLMFTFPEAGSYTLSVDGKPVIDPDAFNSFSTSFDYYVKSSASPKPNLTQKDSQSNPLPIIGGTVILVILFVLHIRRGRG